MIPMTALADLNHEYPQDAVLFCEFRDLRPRMQPAGKRSEFLGEHIREFDELGCGADRAVVTRGFAMPLRSAQQIRIGIKCIRVETTRAQHIEDCGFACE